MFSLSLDQFKPVDRFELGLSFTLSESINLFIYHANIILIVVCFMFTY